MSTRPDDIVHVLSRYLARHLSDEELLAELERVGTDHLPPDPGDLASELVYELRTANHKRGFIEVLVRETLEAIALS
jgi:hypothetical protein